MKRPWSWEHLEALEDLPVESCVMCVFFGVNCKPGFDLLHSEGEVFHLGPTDSQVGKQMLKINLLKTCLESCRINV